MIIEQTGAGMLDVVDLPNIMTKVIFIVLTLALGISPRELVLLFSASSRAILCLLASVSGTEISDGSEEIVGYLDILL